MQLKKATRKKVKMRLSIASPTGFGKTYGALHIAYGITGDWTKIAVIDTENGSASLYSHLGDYNVIEIEPDYTPAKYIQAIKTCEDAGMEVIIIDSVTHVWKGQGGLLEYNNNLGGRYQDWAKTTPLYQQWLNAILHSSCHVISTMRKKQAYALIEEGSKKKVEKKGLEDEIRDGFDYEQTVAFEIANENHMCHVAKDRTQLFGGKPDFVITPETGRLIKEWCETGVDAAELERQEAERKAAIVADSVKTAIAALKKATTVQQMSEIKAFYPAETVQHPDFVAAGKAHYAKLTTPTEEPQHVADWRIVLENLKSSDELAALYKDNKEVMDTDPDVNALYKTAAKRLSKPQTATA